MATSNPDFRLGPLCYLAALGALYFNIQPIFLGAVAESFSLDELQLGSLSTIGLASAFFGLASSYYWITRLDWQRCVAVGLGVSLAATCVLYVADGYAVVAFSSALLGVGMSLVYAPVLVTLGSSANPTRSFGYAITTMVLVAGGIVLVVPTVLMPKWGLSGFAGLLFLVFIVGYAFLRAVPKGIPVLGKSGSTRKAQPVLAWIGLGATAVYFVGVNANWAFLEIIGNSFGLDDTTVSFALAFSLVGGAFGSAAASVLNTRVSAGLALGIAVLGMVGYVIVMNFVAGNYGFTIGLLVFNFAWNFSLPFQMNIVAESDDSGRFIALIPAGQMVGAGIGPVLAGGLLMSVGVEALYGLLVISSVIALAIFVWVSQRQNAIVQRSE